MYLTVGLGNPGKEYTNTRHNVGEVLITNLALFFNKDFSKTNVYKFFKSDYEGQELVCIIPLSYVNESGLAVKKALSQFPDPRLIVIHDDLDIPFGSIRIKKGGRSGGHNGLNSIIKSIGSGDFWRIKIGIGRPPTGKDPADFVLSDFKKQELKELPFIIENAKEALFDLIKDGPDLAMNKWH